MATQTSQYKKEDLDHIMHQEVEIGIGDANSEEVIFTYKGKLISYNLAAHDPELPIDFHFHTDYGSIKHFNISELKNIRVL